VEKGCHLEKDSHQELIRAAAGEIDSDIVFEGGSFLDVFTGKFKVGDVAVKNGHICGIDESYVGNQVVDLGGDILVPGFVDSHVHIESSLLVPARFEQAVLPCGTTTVVWDPHEIANV